MAEGNREDENPNSFRDYTIKKERNGSEDSDGTEDTYVQPDLGIGNEPCFERKTENVSAGHEQPKREENPFSFKHFLRRDTPNSYHSTGARPKVYSNSSSDSFSHLNTPDSDPGLYSPRHAGTPELTSVLPDFVQDHLVVEQCYLNHSDSAHLTVNLDNLPDFALNSSLDSVSRSRLWDDPSICEVLNSDVGVPLREVETTPLDLPTSASSFAPNRLPFDLPLVGEMHDAVVGEVGVSKSLPDFLSDGPIHSSRLCDVSQPTNESPDNNTDRVSPLSLPENERLRRELEAARRQLVEQTRRIQILEQELHSIRTKEQEEITALEKAVESVEDNLKRSTRRAVTAENTVSKLKQEMKSMMNELTSLRQENQSYHHHNEAGAFAPFHTPEQLQVQRVAQDLRQAASTAEQSLRTLIAGVSNLRSMASTLDSLDRYNDDYDKDPDDGSKPGL